MSNEYKDNVGKRVLIEWGIRNLLEVRILEVAPSGVRAKIKGDNIVQWVNTFQHEIIEVLPENRPFLEQPGEAK